MNETLAWITRRVRLTSRGDRPPVGKEAAEEAAPNVRIYDGTSTSSVKASTGRRSPGHKTARAIRPPGLRAEGTMSAARSFNPAGAGNGHGLSSCEPQRGFRHRCTGSAWGAAACWNSASRNAARGKFISACTRTERGRSAGRRLRGRQRRDHLAARFLRDRLCRQRRVTPGISSFPPRALSS
jgi:hypothetical protein